MDDVAARFREFVFLDRRRAAQGLTPGELVQWTALKRLLGRELTPEIPDARSDERGSLRVPVRMRASFPSLGALGHCLMTNLSRGGVFVAAEQLLPIGTRVVLRLAVEAEARTLEVAAEVVSHGVGPARVEPQGMGLRFVDTDGAQRKQLDAVYERALQAAFPSGKK